MLTQLQKLAVKDLEALQREIHLEQIEMFNEQRAKEPDSFKIKALGAIIQKKRERFEALIKGLLEE